MRIGVERQELKNPYRFQSDSEKGRKDEKRRKWVWTSNYFPRQRNNSGSRRQIRRVLIAAVADSAYCRYILLKKWQKSLEVWGKRATFAVSKINWQLAIDYRDKKKTIITN